MNQSAFYYPSSHRSSGLGLNVWLCAYACLLCGDRWWLGGAVLTILLPGQMEGGTQGRVFGGMGGVLLRLRG